MPVPALLVILFGAAVLPPRAAVDVVVRTVDGEQLVATGLSLSGAVLQIRSSAGTREVPLDHLVVLDCQGAADEPRTDDAALVLADGSQLIGRLRDGDEEAVRLESASLGPLALPIDALAKVAFGARADRVDPATLPRRNDLDVVYRRGTAQGDFVSGTIVRLGRAGVTIDSDLGEISLAADRVLGVTIAKLEEAPPAPRLPVDIELTDDGRLRAGLLELGIGQMVVATAFAKRLVVPLDKVRRVRFSSGAYTYLSDLDPIESAERPYIGGADDFLFPWRRDRTVTGAPLVVAGQPFGKGLGMHSRAALTYELAGGYRRFLAKVGVADEVLAQPVSGSLEVVVLVDGVERFRSAPLRPGHAAVPVEVDVAGGVQLTILVDFAERGDVGDRAVIGDAILVAR